MAIIEKKTEVRFTDVNAKLELTNRALLSYFEDIATEHGKKVGCSALNVNETKLTWILLSWHVEVISRPIYTDIITIKTWTRKSPKKLYSYRDFEVLDKNNNIIAKATSKWVLFNIDKKMPVKISDELLTAFEPEDKSVFEEEKIVDKIKLEDIGCVTYTHSVSRRDIDFNLHMHNVYYLDVANEALPFDAFMSENFNKLDIVYKKQFVYKETIDCYLHIDNIEHAYYITLNDIDDTTHATIKLYN